MHTQHIVFVVHITRYYENLRVYRLRGHIEKERFQMGEIAAQRVYRKNSGEPPFLQCVRNDNGRTIRREFSRHRGRSLSALLVVVVDVVVIVAVATNWPTRRAVAAATPFIIIIRKSFRFLFRQYSTQKNSPVHYMFFKRFRIIFFISLTLSPRVPLLCFFYFLLFAASSRAYNRPILVSTRYIYIRKRPVRFWRGQGSHTHTHITENNNNHERTKGPKEARIPPRTYTYTIDGILQKKNLMLKNRSAKVERKLLQCRGDVIIFIVYTHNQFFFL